MVRRGTVLVEIVILASGVVAFVHHVRGARFVADAKPVQVSLESCSAILTAYGYGSSAAESICADARGLPWFAFEVHNVGHRGAWLNRCFVRALDSTGTVVYRTEIGFAGAGPPNGPAGPYVDPGDIFRYRWYSEAQYPNALAVRFFVDCPPIDYHGNIPR